MGNHWEIVVLWGGKELWVNANPENFNPNLNKAFIQLSKQGVFLLPVEN